MCADSDSCVAISAVDRPRATSVVTYDTGATLIRTYPYTSPSGKSGTVSVYTGEGVGFNDPNGTERNESGYYETHSHSCHVGLSGGHEAIAAKRPATTGYPTKVDPL